MDYYNYNNQMNRRDFIAVSALSLTSMTFLNFPVLAGGGVRAVRTKTTQS